MADVDTDAGNITAAEIVGSVDDLLLEIFRRVPSKKKGQKNYPLFLLASKHLNSQASYYYPLIQLRLVSRRWNSLISNNFLLPKPFPAIRGLIFECDPNRPKKSYSIFSDRSISTASNYILFLNKSKTTHEPFRKIGDTWHSHFKVVHSCNGLLLCASKRTSQDYSVCNPTTGKHSTLPHVPSANNRVVIHGMYLAFDPCKSPHYKVVCVLGSEKDIRYFQFLVYSSETGSWEKCGKMQFKTKNVSFGNNNHNNNGVYWNGAIHWVVGSSELICFNLDDEDRLAPPKVMPMPINASNHLRYYFGESYGHLHYIGLDDGVRELVVHEMSSDYSGWAVNYRVDVTNAVIRADRYDTYYDDFDVYAVVRGESSEDTFLVLGTCRWDCERKKIVRFNHHDQTCETIYDFSVPKITLENLYELRHSGSKNTLENPYELRPFQYIESLASV